MMIPIYTILIGRSPCADLLAPESSCVVKICLGHGTVKGLHAHIKKEYPGALAVSREDFRAEVARRQVHTPAMLALLSRYNLQDCVAYVSKERSLSSSSIDRSVCIQDASTEYYTYIVVPEVLDEEVVRLYSLTFVSHPHLVRDFPATFFAADRYAARTQSGPLALAYIERLEEIAETAWQYYQHSHDLSYRDELYNALERISFLG